MGGGVIYRVGGFRNLYALNFLNPAKTESGREKFQGLSRARVVCRGTEHCADRYAGPNDPILCRTAVTWLGVRDRWELQRADASPKHPGAGSILLAALDVSRGEGVDVCQLERLYQPAERGQRDLEGNGTRHQGAGYGALELFLLAGLLAGARLAFRRGSNRNAPLHRRHFGNPRHA